MKYVATVTINLRAKFHLPISYGTLAVAMKMSAKRKHSCGHHIIIYTLQSYYPTKVRYFSQIYYHPTFQVFSPRLLARAHSMLLVKGKR
jgi:hypothetical protein